MSEIGDVENNKAKAVDFLNSVVTGRIDEAYAKHIDMEGMHHNVYFPAGFPALKKAMLDSHGLFPHKQFQILNVIGEGDMIAVHSRIVLKPGEPEMAVVHMFRFGNGKVVEMWDIGQEIPTESPNQDGAG